MVSVCPAAPAASVAGAPAAVGLALARPSPDPFGPDAGGLTASYSLPAAAQVRAGLYDLAGARVARVMDGPVTAGNHVLRWDGRADDGRPAPAGLYVIRLETAAGTRTRKIVVVR